jgi:molybdopterin synthase sulfur carrier subunit
MVDVNLWSGLRRFADGQTVVSVEAQTVRQMLAALTEDSSGS